MPSDRVDRQTTSTGPIFIAGMHRSGTSMIARLLALCGLDLGEEHELVPPTPDNPDGYWEHERFVELNDQLLSELGGGWDCPPLFPSGWSTDERFLPHREHAETLVAQFGEAAHWGWKDPRNSLTLPFWQDVVPNLRVVVCVRHPVEVAHSLRRRAMSSEALTLSLWHFYNQRLLDATKPGDRLFTHYGRFHDAPEVEVGRIASFAGLDPSAETVAHACSSIRPQRRHFAYDSGQPVEVKVPQGIADLYGMLCELSGVTAGLLPVEPGKGRASVAVGVSSDQSDERAWLRESLERQDAILTGLAEKVDRLDQRQTQQREMLGSLGNLIKRQGQETLSILYSLETKSEPTSGTQSTPKEVRYRDTTRRIRDVVRETLPEDAVVSVVSKGDGELLRLHGRPTRHFPSDADGRYTGYHPKNDTVAVLQLEGQRASGSQFLLIPSPSLWWLDHYRGLRTHLENHYREVVRQDDVCRIYDLRHSPLEAGDSGAIQALVEQLGFHLNRDPNVLDWTREGLLAGVAHAVVFRTDGNDVLPYLDRSIDVVAVDDGDEAKAREASRVAALSVVHLGGKGVQVESRKLAGGSATSVSVVIPVYDGLRYTKACLDSLRATVPASWDVEIIVVDDCSTDSTAEFLDDVVASDSRLRVVRNDQNKGFLGSANGGAAEAKGDLLVFLNNDTVLLPGWLPPLLRTFREFPEAGVVGGRLVYPDGRLQEAGGAVFSDGSAAKVGYGETDIDDPLFTFVRPVDYCSGALLATPRELFGRIGGFDTRYGFGYYEDVDYCFSVRALGRSVLYQPEATIIHVEGGTAGTDLTVGAKRNQVANQALFASRWRQSLADHPTRPQAFSDAFWRRMTLCPSSAGANGR